MLSDELAALHHVGVAVRGITYWIDHCEPEPAEQFSLLVAHHYEERAAEDILLGTDHSWKENSRMIANQDRVAPHSSQTANPAQIAALAEAVIALATVVDRHTSTLLELIHAVNANADRCAGLAEDVRAAIQPKILIGESIAGSRD